MERLFQPGLLTGLFLLIFSPLSSASELAHGPLTLPGGDGEQLSFYRDAEQVLAQVQDDKGSKTLDSFPSATQVVAVFYQDLDGDEQREVLVMLKTGSELSIRDMVGTTAIGSGCSACSPGWTGWHLPSNTSPWPKCVNS